MVRLITMNALNIYLTNFIVSLAKGEQEFLLVAWIVIACILSIAFIVQDWLTSNIAILDRNKNTPRRINLFEVAIFAVVPVGIARCLSRFTIHTE